MLKKVCFHLIGLLIIGFLMVGCAKKKNYKLPSSKYSGDKKTQL